MPSRHKSLTYEILKQKFVDEKKTITDISKELGLCQTTIRTSLNFYGLRQKIIRIDNKLNLENQTIGIYTVIKRDEGVDKHWVCSCNLCGSIVSVKLNNSRQREVSYCQFCRTKNNGVKLRKGFKEIRSGHWGRIIHTAKRRGIEFNITMEYGWEIFLIQERKCALTGELLYFQKFREKRSCATASLDRIDSSKGYIKGNIQWVHKDVNIAKWAFPQRHFINICNRVSQKQIEWKDSDEHLYISSI